MINNIEERPIKSNPSNKPLEDFELLEEYILEQEINLDNLAAELQQIIDEFG